MSESMYNITAGMRDKVSKRSRVLVWNILASFLVKGWAAVVMLMMVPLTLHCLGIYQNGVWLTISSVLVWIDYMDIGLGNGLRNKLAMHMAHGDTEEARCVVSSTMVMLVCVVIPMLGILLLLIWQTDVYAFLNVEREVVPEMRAALTCAVILACATFALKFIGNVYMGMQLPVVNNVLLALGQTVALIGTWLLYVTDHATFLNVVSVNTGAPFLVYALSYPYTFYCRYPILRPSMRHIQFHSVWELGDLGIKFFFLQMAGVVQFMSANILISMFFTPALVTPYQICYRYISLVLVVFTIICTPIWSATTDAFERNDMMWIEGVNVRMGYMMWGIWILLVFMVMVSPWVYGVWIGNGCEIPWGMTVLMAVQVFLMVCSMRYSYFLNGMGVLRLQLCLWIMPIIFIPLAWYVNNLTHNIYWFMAVMCFCTAPSAVVNMIQFHKIIKGTAKGIWRI